MIGIVIVTVCIVLMIIYLVWFYFGQQKISITMSIIVNAIMITISIAAFAGGITVYSRHSTQNDIEPESQTEVQTDILESQEDEPEGEHEYVPDEVEIENDLQESTTNVLESGTESPETESGTENPEIEPGTESPKTEPGTPEGQDDENQAGTIQTGEVGDISTESVSTESEDMSTESESTSIEAEDVPADSKNDDTV